MQKMFVESLDLKRVYTKQNYKFLEVLTYQMSLYNNYISIAYSHYLELSPRNLQAFAKSPIIFTAFWKSPSKLNSTKSHQYLVSWVGPSGKSHSIFTNQTNVRIDGLSGVYGGYQLFLTVCFVYVPHDSAEDCTYSNILMPEGIPIRGPHLKECTRISEKVPHETIKL